MIYLYLPDGSRLGNWMFMYSLAISLGDQVCFTSPFKRVHDLYAKYPGFFGNTPLVSFCPSPIREIKEKSFTYSPIARPKPKEDVLIRGGFQSEKYFDENRVRAAFRIKSDMRQKLMRDFGDWLMRPQVTGISVRRTDYMRLAFTLPFCGEQYYRDCIAKLEAQDFIVCSDDYAWCKKFFPKAFPNKHFLFMEGRPVLEQLYIHALCQNVIMSNSSFSWWGAWLNEVPNKRVFMPSMWLGFSQKHVDWSSIYFKGAEVVPNHYTWGLWLRARILWTWRCFKVKFYPIKKFLLGR